MAQENRRLPSAPALQAPLLLQAAHRDPEVRQNQQPQWGHFHHENQDCHGSPEGQLNLEGQVHPFLQWDLPDPEDPGDLEDLLLRRFQLSLQHPFLLCHLCHPSGLEFLQFLSLLAYLEVLVGLYLRGSLMVLDCLWDRPGRGPQPFPSHQAAPLFLVLLSPLGFRALLWGLMGQLLQDLQELPDHLAFHLPQEALEDQEAPESPWGPEVPALLAPQLDPGGPRDQKDRLHHLFQELLSVQEHQHFPPLQVFQGHHCYLWGLGDPCCRAALGFLWSLEDPAGRPPQEPPKAQVFLQDLELQDFLSDPEHLAAQVHLAVLGPLDLL